MLFFGDNKVLSTNNTFVRINSVKYIDFYTHKGHLISGMVELDNKAEFAYNLRIAVYNKTVPNSKIFYKEFIFPEDTVLYTKKREVFEWMPIEDLQPNIDLVIYDPLLRDVSKTTFGKVINVYKILYSGSLYKITSTSAPSIVLDQYLIGKR